MKTPHTNIVIKIPVELNAIAPIAQPLSGLKYSSGILLHRTCNGSGTVPCGQAIHCVGSVGWRIWNERNKQEPFYFDLIRSIVEYKEKYMKAQHW